MEKNLQKMAVLHHILYITVKRGAVKGYMISIGAGLGKLEGAKGEGLWDGIKVK